MPLRHADYVRTGSVVCGCLLAWRRREFLLLSSRYQPSAVRCRRESESHTYSLAYVLTPKSSEGELYIGQVRVGLDVFYRAESWRPPTCAVSTQEIRELDFLLHPRSRNKITRSICKKIWYDPQHGIHLDVAGPPCSRGPGVGQRCAWRLCSEKHANPRNQPLYRSPAWRVMTLASPTSQRRYKGDSFD